MGNQIDRSFLIIETLSENGHLDINSIYKKTNIPISTIFKILVNLEKLGYVSRHFSKEQSDHWFLNLKFLKISRLILSRFDFKEEIREILVNLSKEIKETVQLGVYINKKFIYIDVIKAPSSIIAYIGIGMEFHFNLCAAGLVLAASLPNEELDILLENTILPKNTPHSISEPNKIRELLKKVKKDGYAFDNEYYYIGVRCLAAPVYDFEGKVIAAINITGHISTISDQRLDFLKTKLLEAAFQASKKIGFNK